VSKDGAKITFAQHKKRGVNPKTFKSRLLKKGDILDNNKKI